MVIKNLYAIPFATLMECFLKAFEGYFVTMPADPEYYRERWKRAKVDYSLSYGMFDNEALVGFIIHAIDERNGHKTAFNTGTGVIPEYRGKRIVHSLYEHAIPELQKEGVSLCALEVITKNEKAIKAYEGIGFTITKRYKCYSGSFNVKTETSDYELEKVAASYFNWETIDQKVYSWDNHIETLQKGTYDYYVVSLQNKPIAYFIIDPKSGYVAQFDVFENDPPHWTRLFSAIQTLSENIRINNVDERLQSKVNYLDIIALKNTVDQFEMELSI